MKQASEANAALALPVNLGQSYFPILT